MLHPKVVYRVPVNKGAITTVCKTGGNIFPTGFYWVHVWALPNVFKPVWGQSEIPWNQGQTWAKCLYFSLHSTAVLSLVTVSTPPSGNAICLSTNIFVCILMQFQLEVSNNFCHDITHFEYYGSKDGGMHFAQVLRNLGFLVHYDSQSLCYSWSNWILSSNKTCTSLSNMCPSMHPAGGRLLPADLRQRGNGGQQAACFPWARRNQPPVEHHPRWPGALPPQTQPGPGG